MILIKCFNEQLLFDRDFSFNWIYHISRWFVFFFFFCKNLKFETMNDIQPTNRRRKKRPKTRCYESLLNHFKKSPDEIRNIDNLVFLNNGKRRITRGMLKKFNEQNALLSLSKECPSRNSVIVISDSDNETSEKDKEDASLSIIECGSTILPSSSQRKTGHEESPRQNKNRSVLSNLSIMQTSTQSSCNGENIAPSQTEDDIIELWSSLKNLKPNNKCKEITRYYDETNEKVKFVIDTKPNLKNLEYLKTDVEVPVWKRRKLHHNFDKLTLSSNKSKKKEQCVNDANSNFLQYNSKSYDCDTNAKMNVMTNIKLNLKHLEYLKKNEKSVKKKRKQSHNFDEFVSSLNKNQKKEQHINADLNLSQSKAKFCEKEIETKVSDEQNSSDSNHKLREIIVDGCNVGMAHANHQMFSVKGIQLVVNYFTIRGHVVKVFLPNYLRKYTILEELYKKGIVVFTPSRNVNGKQITPYDDRFILEYATACRGIVISSDQYRDLYKEKPEWRDTILNRLLSPTFVGDYIMFPDDPLGKSGPNLETFLRH